MRRQKLALFFLAAMTLMLELLLTRVFDVILTPNMAYMVISCALFSFGLAGIHVALRPLSSPSAEKSLPWMAALLAAATLLILPLFNVLPFDYEQIAERPLFQAALFLAMYLVLVVPFFLSGTLFTVLFSTYAERIQTLYFWDLTGAALGCLVIVPLLPPIGPGGILFLASAFALFASALLSSSSRWSVAVAAVGLALIAVPWLRSPEYYDFAEHVEKRGVREAREEGRVELTYWDPVSKIDVFDQVRIDPTTGRRGGTRKHVAYDGGTQSSHIFPFDGDYQRLRSRVIERGEEPLWDHFWHRGVLASHYLKRGSGPRVLVIGSAGGQETKAALLYGASRVDAVELVRAVVELGVGKYSAYNGGIFLDPRVSVHASEGRSFLRASAERYDIIQIHSNHTSSSIAAGTGAMAPTYLQTADAYREFFSHLSPNGVLHVNHHVYPRMVTTAALAWRQMGRRDFDEHVLLFDMVGIQDPLPTFLVKMSPWTRGEVEELEAFFSDIGDEEIPFEIVHHPLDRDRRFLSDEFFSGDLSPGLVERMDFRVRAATDDRPFFNFLRKRIAELEPDAAKFTDVSTALLLNSQLRKGVVPMDLVHLLVTAAVSLFFAFVFVALPLYASEAGRASWRGRYASIVYFSCLGAGFIVIELVFIQIFMKLVGYPVHTYALVIFTILLGAGAGSLASEKLSVAPDVRWWWPFAGIVVTVGPFTLLYPVLFDPFLAAADEVRMIVAAALIFPIGFFLGMPFPLGILAVSRGPRGAVAWAWGMNGLFTVIGGLASVASSLLLGFRLTLTLALAIYAAAFLSFAFLRDRPLHMDDG